MKLEYIISVRLHCVKRPPMRLTLFSKLEMDVAESLDELRELNRKKTEVPCLPRIQATII